MPRLLESRDVVGPSLDRFCEWAAAQRDALDGWLHQSGAVLLRGFDFRSAGAFRAVAEATQPELRPYVGGDSPRTAVMDRVYTSTNFSPHLEIGLHNELAMHGRKPYQGQRRILVAMG